MPGSTRATLPSRTRTSAWRLPAGVTCEILLTTDTVQGHYVSPALLGLDEGEATTATPAPVAEEPPAPEPASGLPTLDVVQPDDAPAAPAPRVLNPFATPGDPPAPDA